MNRPTMRVAKKFCITEKKMLTLDKRKTQKAFFPQFGIFADTALWLYTVV